MSALQEALTLRASGDGDWHADADPRYESISGMFGGWTAAVLLRSVLDDPDRQGTPAAMTVNFVARVEPGTQVTVRAEHIGGGRSLGHWRAALLAADDGPVLAHAMLVFANRRDTDGFTELTMPEAPHPDSLGEFRPPGPQGQRTLLRPITGHPPFGRTSTASSGWVREESGRAVDHLQLAYLADAYAPRIFFTSDGPRPSATMTLSVNFLATDEELAAVGDDYLLNEATGTRAVASTIGQQARLWSRTGDLLATTEQLCWYK